MANNEIRIAKKLCKYYCKYIYICARDLKKRKKNTIVVVGDAEIDNSISSYCFA